MKDYEVTVSRTGAIKVKANSSQEAAKKVTEMSTEQVEKIAAFCDYEVTDACELPEPEYYYVIVMKDTKEKRFFRTGIELSGAKDITEYAICEKGIGKAQKDISYAERLDEDEYCKQIIACLKTKLEYERNDYHDELKKLTLDDVISSVGKIQFFEDMIHVLDDKENDEDLVLSSIEVLLETVKPLDYLYETHYGKIDFSDANIQMIGLFNLEG